MENNIQSTIEDEVSGVLSKLESRVVQVGKSGLKYFTGQCKYLLKDLRAARKAKDKEIYENLMAVETLAKEIEPSESSARILKKIYEIKRLVSVLCLSLLIASVFIPNFPTARSFSRSRSAARTVRVVRSVRRYETQTA